MVKRACFIFLQLSWAVLPASLSAATPVVAPSGAHLQPPSSVRPAPAALSATGSPVAPKPLPEYQLYNYYGDRYRDPFVALNGEYRSEQGADRPPQISSLLLKGIIQDEKSRMALLTSGVSSYILRGGRLYDGRNHLMKGISGVIKPNSVVLMGSDRTVRELKVTVTL